MIQISEKENCCGCTACFNACPKEAIKMQPDEEGFLYPKVDETKCIECGLCESVCPVITMPKRNTHVNLKSYVMRSKNEDVLKQSTSGGFITPLIEYVLNNQGVICAATYNDDFGVEHQILSEGGVSLSRIRGSKYVQSNLNNCFKEIKRYLEQEKEVCFVGTTCQAVGLKSYLRKEYENLIIVDLVCHGTPSPKLWDKYLKYQKNEYHSEIVEISFRNKTYGYHSGTMMIKFKNGKTYYGSARVDYMLKSFFREISSRPICYSCPFKTLERCSDFTIYDCWHASQLVDGLKDDDKGYTNVIVQSEKGQEVLEKIRESYYIYLTDTNAAVDADGIMVLHSAKSHPKRGEFYKDLDKDSLPEHIQRFIPISGKDHFAEMSKKFFYQTGLLGVVKGLRKQKE